MSRKTLIFFMAVLLAMFVAIGIAIAFLYSGTGARDQGREVSLKGASGCLAAIPSDAVLVACSSRMDRAFQGVLSSFALPDSLYAEIDKGGLASLKRCPVAVSLHYSGKLIPLYVFDMDGASENASGILVAKLESHGCKTLADGHYLLASESDALIKSASRHLDIKVSIVDAPGFADALDSVEGDVLLFVPALHSRRLLSAVGDRKLTRYSSFMERLADWTAFSVECGDDKPFSFAGSMIYDGEPDEFITALEDCTPSASHVSEVLPSYAVSFVSVPVSDNGKYVSAYKSFVDSRQNLHNLTSKQKALGASAGIMPEDFFKALDVKEVANASFKVDGKLEKVNLISISSKEAVLVFKGNEVTSFRGYVPAVHSWAYAGFAASVYGDMFALEDESCFTFVNGWIISGSRAAIEEYVVRKALDYNLSMYMADAGKSGLLTGGDALVLMYYSLTEDRDQVASILKTAAERKLSEAMDADLAPVVVTVGKAKGKITLQTDVHSLTLKKTKAPSFERDTTVVVPSGPFKVKNSHTGKMNTFYQNAQKSLCLRDENGKDLWGVPFGKNICGIAQNVDFYANGKLQIIFGAGSQVYVIDRLGRYVSGFPLDLGKEILIGPHLYDFSGAKKYNIMVLHKDNTIEMYNLKGRKPDAWKGIAPSETIKSLPEMLVVGGNNFWVVRTSMQTLIYPFYGGEPVTVLEGDSKIRPDSEVKVVDGTSVQVNCYNGKTRTVKIK